MDDALARAHREGIRVAPKGAVYIPLYGRDGSIRAHTLVDEADVAWVTQWRWAVYGSRPSRWYAGRHSAPRIDGKYPARLLHRELLGLPTPSDGREVDHIDLNRLNNRRANLRVVTHEENLQNLPSVGRTSRHRGVHWNESHRRWEATGSIARHRYHLGFFLDEEEAAAVARAWRARHMPRSADAMASLAPARAS